MISFDFYRKKLVQNIALDTIKRIYCFMLVDIVGQ
jgi:hypothetical protein